jgi:CrcB protein
MAGVSSRFLWVCFAGAVGTGARYLLGGWILLIAGAAFPWGTLAINALGSFALGAIMHVALATTWIAPTLRVALTTGVMGGFTTYSTFNYETLELLRTGSPALAAANVAATVLVCLAAGASGVFLARWLVGAA